MPSQSVSIKPTFAAETEFEVKAQTGSWQLDLAEAEKAPVAHQLRPLAQQLFEKRGVPFSALND